MKRGSSTRSVNIFARFVMLLIGMMALAGPGVALPADNPLIGTWRLKSFVREDVATGAPARRLANIPAGMSATRQMGECMHCLSPTAASFPPATRQPMPSGRNCTSR